MKCQETRKTNQSESTQSQLPLPGMPPLIFKNPYAELTEVQQIAAIMGALSLLSYIVPLWRYLSEVAPFSLGTQEMGELIQSVSLEMETLTRNTLDLLKMFHSTSRVYAWTLKMAAAIINFDVYVLLDEAGLT